MWPLSGLEIVRACGAASWSPSIEALVIAGVSFGDVRAMPDDLFVALREGDYDGHGHVNAALDDGAALALVARDWDGVAALAPDHASRCLVVDDTRVAFRRLAAHLRTGFTFPVVAIGGSNGKTTTKEMLAALLSGGGHRVTRTPDTMNGWTGIPLTLALRDHARATPPDALVVEIGIDAVGAMGEHVALARPDVVVITALGVEHLAGLGDEATAIAEEMKLFDAPNAKRVLHLEVPALEQITPRDGDVLVCKSTREVSNAYGVLAYDVTTPSPLASEVRVTWRPPNSAEPTWRARFHVAMAGAHNGTNLALAIGAGLALGRSPDDLGAGFASFVAPSMRCEVHTLPDGTILIDDSYNASPASVMAALELFVFDTTWRDRSRLVILGDMLDLGDASAHHHRQLAGHVASVVARGAKVCLYGDAMLEVQRALAVRDVPTTHVPSSGDPCALLEPADVILVKGSRGMALERVVAEIFVRAEPSLPRSLVASLLAPVDPSAFLGRFSTVCVTGTNGKTTTTSLIGAIVEAAGETSCRVTTLGAWVGGESTGEEPTAENFLRTLRTAAERHVRTLAIETTSQALAEGFARTWPPTVGVFTNLSRDHLDYHGTPELYLASKAQLFMSLPPDGVAVLNAADPASALLHEITPDGVRRLGYAARAIDPACAAIPLALHATAIAIDEHGTHATLAPSPLADALGRTIDLALVGEVHVENALAATLAAHALGYRVDAIRTALTTFAGVPGRFEIIHRKPIVVVDFAHTPDALARTLAVARSLVGEGGQVLCVFGCGGDRDPGKRSEMGAIAGASADLVIVTSDNPRSEDPAVIADVVEKGASEGRARVLRILDRGQAIATAVEVARRVDIVVIAGKGHEKTQTIGERELPFDDVEVARKALMTSGMGSETR